MKKFLLQSIHKSLVNESELWSVNGNYVCYKREENYPHKAEIEIYTGYSFGFENPSQIKLNFIEKWKLERAVKNMIAKKILNGMKK